MNLKQFGDCIDFNIEHNIRHAILGLGAPGLGKSQIIKQIGEKHGFKVIDIRLAQMSEVEIGGLIFPNEDRTKTRWLSPEVLPDEERDGKNTILLLDEITSCPKRVQVAAYQLILDRRVGQYQLPEGCFVVALGNREDDDGVFVRLAGPLADRFEIHYIDIDFDSWKNDYALNHGIHQSVIDFLTFKPQALHTQDTAGESMVFATPRSWERVSDILNIDSDVSKTVVCNKIIGNVGPLEGTQFIEFCKNKEGYITVESFLQGAKAPEAPEEVAILTKALEQKVLYIKDVKEVTSLDEKQKNLLDSVIKAMFRLGSSEYTVIGLKKLVGLNRRIVRETFLLLDDENINAFLEDNKIMLGIG